MAIMNDDVNQLERFLDHGANDLLQVGTTVIVVSGIMFSLAPEVAILAILPVPIIVGGSFLYQRRIGVRYTEVRKEVAELNAVCDGWYEERGADIDVPGQGQLFFPLLNYPEFDQTIFHPSSLPLVGAILGGVENVRHIEFNFRGWQPVTSDYGMSWHPDDCSGGLLTLEQRQTRSPYGPPDMLSTFTCK